MGRPREHDPKSVRAKVMRSFWRNGFDSASMAELEAAAGINRRQLARDYGNKRGLFLQALDDFHEAVSAKYLRRLGDEDAGLGTIETTLTGLGAASRQMGCLMCNTSLEPIAREDREVRAKVQAFFADIEASYFQALERAFQKGQISLRRAQWEKASRQLLATHVAVIVLARSRVSPAVVSDVIEGALEALRREDSC